MYINHTFLTIEASCFIQNSLLGSMLICLSWFEQLSHNLFFFEVSLACRDASMRRFLEDDVTCNAK